MTTPRAASAGRLAVVLAVLAIAAALAAPAAHAGEDWADLSPAQRAALTPLRAQWDGLDDGSRARWLDVATRFPTLSSDERARVQARMGEWSRLSPNQRGQARLQFQEARRWTPEERQQRWEAYQSLDPQARRVLADRWKREAPNDGRTSGGPDGSDGKRNWVEPAPPSATPPTTASPTSVRARSGATTQPITRAGDPPLALQPQTGVPKITATEGFVDPATLLPRRGPQGAAATPPAANDRPARSERKGPKRP